MLFRKKQVRLAQRLSESAPTQGYWSIIRTHFRKNRLAIWSLRALYFLLFVAIFADFLANDQPILCKIESKWQTPILRQYAIDWGFSDYSRDFRAREWLDVSQYDFYIFPPIPYAPDYQDRKNRNLVGPFAIQDVESGRFRHWLGTDKLGRDTAAGLIGGTRIAMLVGIVAMSIAGFIGIFLGGLAGYFGDEQLRISIVQLLLLIVGFFIAFFYAFISRSYHLQEAGDHLVREIFLSLLIFAVILLAFASLGGLLSKISILEKSITFPADIVVMRLIEIFNSVPALLLILASVAIIKKPSILYIMLILGLLSWTGIARFIRAELLRIRQLEYIQAARALGFKEAYTFLRHAIPNALSPVLITIAFGIAGAILAEAALSFLGIGVNPDTVSWGSMLSLARRNFDAWWLAVFPGIAIFVTVTIFNLIGDGLTEALSAQS
ncbi:MAG: ABC transporter permease [Bacteroidota bacterium]